MLLYTIGNTELSYAKTENRDGVVLIIRKGQISITIPIPYDILLTIIKELQFAVTINEAKRSLSTKEVRKVAGNVKFRNDKDKD
jgi:hypothetical protein